MTRLHPKLKSPKRKPRKNELDMTRDEMIQAAHRVDDAIIAQREDAARDGSRGDNGAHELAVQVAYWRMGMAGQWPAEWNRYITQFDPEFKEYQRLKAKFGGT